MKNSRIAWRSPSNLAIIKYWGKYGRQLPRNASISLTLQNAYSETSLEFEPKQGNGLVELAFTFEGEENTKFKERLQKFLSSITDIMPFLTEYKLTIASQNSFPHSAGIASSASAMSALALCLCTMERQLSTQPQSEDYFYRRASMIARLGSGSAARSVYPHLAVWGATDLAEGSSNDFATPYSQAVDAVFLSYHDDILLVSKSEKSVSSTAGHALMDSNPFASVRYQQAHDNLKELLQAMKTGDVHAFGRIAEQEALQLHALMMTSNPSYILMESQSLEIIKKIRQWRLKTGLALYFSMDAGPNMHLLYPHSIAADVQEFIQQDLVQHCEQGSLLKDRVGKGPIQL